MSTRNFYILSSNERSTSLFRAQCCFPRSKAVRAYWKAKMSIVRGQSCQLKKIWVALRRRKTSSRPTANWPINTIRISRRLLSARKNSWKSVKPSRCSKIPKSSSPTTTLANRRSASRSRRRPGGSRNSDRYIDLPLAPWQAARAVNVPTLDGMVALNSPAMKIVELISVDATVIAPVSDSAARRFDAHHNTTCRRLLSNPMSHRYWFDLSRAHSPLPVASDRRRAVADDVGMCSATLD